MFATTLISLALLLAVAAFLRSRLRRRAELVRENPRYPGSFRLSDEALKPGSGSRGFAPAPAGGTRHEPSRTSSYVLDPMPLFMASSAFSDSDSSCDRGVSTGGDGGWSSDSGSSSSCSDSGGSYSSD